MAGTKEQKALGAHLKELRTEKKLSMERLGYASGISKESVRRIEKGVENPRFLTLLKLSEGLNVSLERLVSFKK
ncbi:MAG: helix-turn-helix transcriptional regulator [Spirochaetia bacterium]|nr:helix-turn-helix transcriptional regulator [Spirochaetia bacterium]